jgi:xylulokinase
MDNYLIAHDLGTSGNKATLFRTDGTLINSFTASYETHFFNGNYAEQNPLHWWQAVINSTRKIMEGIDPSQVLGISFSGQMQGCVIVDKEGDVIRPAMIWADQRAEKQRDYLEQQLGAEKIYQITGHRVSSSYSLEKLMWLKENEAENYQKAKYMLQAKDYIIYKMTGKIVTDYSDASGTQALDLRALKWSKEILATAGVDTKLFPPLYRSTDIAGVLTLEASELLGLTQSVRVVIGGGDGPCSAVGAGCIHENELFMTFGTSAWIGGTTDGMFIDSEKTLFCFAHVIPGKYMPCGAMQAAGSSYSYIRKALCMLETESAIEKGQDPYEVMNKLIQSSPPGSKGLIFLPYLLGERSPRWNPHTSGSFLGIKMKHIKADYIRAVIEGVAMNLELIFKAYHQYLRVDKMIFTGGGAKSETIAQIMADVLKVTLHRPDYTEEATSIAAAVIAGVGIGIYEDFSQVSRFLSVKDTFSYRQECSEIYDRLKPVFDKSYSALLNIYKDFPLDQDEEE